MPEHALQALELYLNLGRNRSLDRLVGECASKGVKASLPTLKRWSARYAWQEALREHERVLSAKLWSASTEVLEETIRSKLVAIQAAKRRFSDRVLLDPTDPTLTPAQRRRALKPTLHDYCKLIKLEMLIWKDLKSRGTTSQPSPPTQRYTDEEVRAMEAAFARVRYGLPPE